MQSIMKIRSSSRFFGLVCLAGACLLGCLPARASFVVSALSASAPANSSGNSFDVILTNTGLSAQTIAVFGLQVSVTDLDISFNAALTNEATVSPYIFAGDSFDINTASAFASLNSLQILNASDLSDSGTGTSVAAGATVGLAHVVFNVANGAAPGVFTLTVSGFPETSLADASFANVTFTTANGLITIPTPEPSTLGLFLIAAPMLFVAKRFARPHSK